MEQQVSNISFMDKPAAPPKKNKGKLIAIIIAVLLIGGLGFLGYRNAQSKKAQEQQQEDLFPTSAPEPTEELTPEASPTAATKTPTPRPTSGVVSTAQDLNIQILNGSGEEGAAGKVKDVLTNKGYKKLETGNADNFDYQKLTIKIKSSKNKFLSTLKSDLSSYSIGTDSGTLSEDSLFDVSIIVGKQ